MPVLALVLIFAWIGLVAGVPAYRRMRRTGEVDVLTRSRPGTAQWWARLLSLLVVVLAIATPVAALAGLPSIAPLDRVEVQAVGIILYIVGIAITLISQIVMGASWRGDVDPDARTELVTAGPFRFVRNPIFTGTTTTVVGLALLVPNVLAVGMVIAVVASLQIQVRLVEEPYLLRVHGDAYRSYAARTGRFVPGSAG